jgi:hypothetical protein
MDQTHIGYTYWQQPFFNKMPLVKYISKDSIKSEIVNSNPTSISSEKLLPKNSKGNKFFELDGYVSIYAEHFTQQINSANIKWKVIPNIGRINSGVSSFPVNIPSQILTAKSPNLQYEFYSYDSGSVKINTQFSPTLNFQNTEGLRCAVSIDDEDPQIIIINEGLKNPRNWDTWVANNIITKITGHTISKSGKHTIKYWVIDPGVVLQRILVDFGGLKQSYLGPEETKFKINQ